MLRVARVPETIRVREHIELFSSYYPAPLKFEHTIAAAGLGGVEKRLFGELSGGQKQRVLFAQMGTSNRTEVARIARQKGWL